LTEEPRKGRLDRTLHRLLARQATVLANERIGARFHLITLGGVALDRVEWIPGNKIQVTMGSILVTRTYTPIEWNGDRTRILAYAHADGPGSRWVEEAVSGDVCHFIGPRTSIDGSRISGPMTAFGDETSLGLIHALANGDPSRTVDCHLEVDDPAEVEKAIAVLGLPNIVIHDRRSSLDHLSGMDEALGRCATVDGMKFVLTGNARSIQRWRQSLRGFGIPSSHIQTKAYWAAGKTGLD